MIITIDPGRSGCIVKANDCAIKAYKMPETPEEINQLLDEDDVEMVVIERIPKYTGKNRPESKVFPLFVNYGVVWGESVALNLPYLLIEPRKWQRPYLPQIEKHTVLEAQKRKDAGKKISKYDIHKSSLWKVAQDLYPDLKFRKTDSDALLLLDWYKNHYDGRDNG